MKGETNEEWLQLHNFTLTAPTKLRHFRKTFEKCMRGSNIWHMVVSSMEHCKLLSLLPLLCPWLPTPPSSEYDECKFHICKYLSQIMSRLKSAFLPSEDCRPVPGHGATAPAATSCSTVGRRALAISLPSGCKYNGCALGTCSNPTITLTLSSNRYTKGSMVHFGVKSP